MDIIWVFVHEPIHVYPPIPILHAHLRIRETEIRWDGRKEYRGQHIAKKANKQLEIVGHPKLEHSE